VEGPDAAREAAADRLVYEAGSGRFLGPGGPASAPAHAELVRFLTYPDLAPADAVALHSRGVRWARAVGVWDAETVAGLSDATVGLAFVDEIWAPAAAKLFRPVRTTAPAVAA